MFKPRLGKKEKKNPDMQVSKSYTSLPKFCFDVWCIVFKFLEKRDTFTFAMISTQHFRYFSTIPNNYEFDDLIIATAMGETNLFALVSKTVNINQECGIGIKWVCNSDKNIGIFDLLDKQGKIDFTGCRRPCQNCHCYYNVLERSLISKNYKMSKKLTRRKEFNTLTKVQLSVLKRLGNDFYTLNK